MKLLLHLVRSEHLAARRWLLLCVALGALWLLLACVHQATVRSQSGRFPISSVAFGWVWSGRLLVIGLALLTARSFHADPLENPLAFWRALPVGRVRLMTAKVAFAALWAVAFPALLAGLPVLFFVHSGTEALRTALWYAGWASAALGLWLVLCAWTPSLRVLVAVAAGAAFLVYVGAALEKSIGYLISGAALWVLLPLVTAVAWQLRGAGRPVLAWVELGVVFLGAGFLGQGILLGERDRRQERDDSPEVVTDGYLSGIAQDNLLSQGGTGQTSWRTDPSSWHCREEVDLPIRDGATATLAGRHFRIAITRMNQQDVAVIRIRTAETAAARVTWPMLWLPRSGIVATLKTFHSSQEVWPGGATLDSAWLNLNRLTGDPALEGARIRVAVMEWKASAGAFEPASARYPMPRFPDAYGDLPAAADYYRDFRNLPEEAARHRAGEAVLESLAPPASMEPREIRQFIANVAGIAVDWRGQAAADREPIIRKLAMVGPEGAGSLLDALTFFSHFFAGAAVPLPMPLPPDRPEDHGPGFRPLSGKYEAFPAPPRDVSRRVYMRSWTGPYVSELEQKAFLRDLIAALALTASDSEKERVLATCDAACDLLPVIEAQGWIEEALPVLRARAGERPPPAGWIPLLWPGAAPGTRLLPDPQGSTAAEMMALRDLPGYPWAECVESVWLKALLAQTRNTRTRLMALRLLGESAQARTPQRMAALMFPGFYDRRESDLTVLWPLTFPGETLDGWLRLHVGCPEEENPAAWLRAHAGELTFDAASARWVLP